MLQKKIERSADFLQQNFSLFQCPNCHQEMAGLSDYSLRCVNHHQFDLSKKGTLYFLTHGIKTDYNKDMLTYRQEMIETGLYQPVLKEIATLLKKEDVTSLVDIGCGEGSFLKKVDAEGVTGAKIGFDISKDGVNMATDQDLAAFWCVADITNLPFETAKISHLLNIFSPSHYQEFQRVLKPEGMLIKVVPASGYLKELRELFYEDDQAKQAYSNEKVVSKFAEEMTLISQKRMTYQVAIPPEKQRALLKMSPLHWGASAESFEKAMENQVETITIDVLLLVGRK